MSLISKFALDQGMNQHVLVVYRHAIDTLVIAPFSIVLDRKIRPKMSLSIFIKILILGLLELEKVNIRRFHSQAKILGTIVTVGGAMLMTLIKGRRGPNQIAYLSIQLRLNQSKIRLKVLS
ncbi:WAT1-related protein [Hibiscus syriacus]|uniref:WAT1-related protein n=1 Tax=Hibiscus syriacus TaxID=106335 RepID=A0A6A2YRX8_HIBSY|nr:WAT1-related protein [Hibiscus syriacus]